MPIQWVSGYTLVESMITVAALLIVAAIAVPVYEGYVKEAEIGRAITDIRQIEFLIAGYETEGVYPDSLADVGADGMRDPWGQPYEYLNIANADTTPTGNLRKDKFLVPVNSDFDLYSIGPDGNSSPPFTSKNSHDDVVRANNGAFVGLAEDY